MIWRAVRIVFRFDQTTRDQVTRIITAPARPTAECIPLIGRKAELPTFRNFRRNAALLQIVAGRFGQLFFQQVVMKPSRGFRMQSQQDAARLVLPIFAVWPPPYDHGDAYARRELAHRRGEIDVLIIHDEAENASAGAAAKTVEGLPLRAYMK